MTENENHSHLFTAQDIERYYTGKMSPQEMHLLEKAALDDPFLADAMDGYRFSPQPEKDMQDLRTALQSRLGAEKVIVLPQKKSGQQFLRIAALFLLIAGAGWMVYFFSLTPVSDNVATTTNLPGKEEQEVADTNLNNSIAGGKAATEGHDVVKNKDGDDTQEPIQSSKNIAKKTAAPKKQNDQENLDRESNTVTLSGYNQNPALKESRISGDTNNSSMASRLKADSTSRITDDTVVADMAGEPLQTVTPGKDNVIVLQRAKNPQMPEVVLNKSKSDSTHRRLQIVFEEAEPEKGTNYYNDYIAENLKIPEDVNFKAPSGEVKLSFDVNDAGVAVNIKVEKSLCEECDKEAIRILQEGPKLVKKRKGKKGKLSIRF